VIKNIFVFALILLSSVVMFPSSAQCIVSSEGDNRPAWIGNVRYHPRNVPNSDFLVISVKERSLIEAHAIAGEEVKAAQSNVVGKWTGEKDRSDIQVRYRCAGEHYEYHGGQYYLWQIVQIAKRPNIELSPIPSGELARLEKKTIGLKPFVPGMAQIHRGSNIGGTLFIVGVSALSVGAITSEVFRADNNDRVGTTFNVAERRKYRDNADMWQNTRDILIVSAGAVYLWNIIDGYVGGKGGQYQAFDSEFKMIPYADLRGGGLILGFNF